MQAAHGAAMRRAREEAVGVRISGATGDSAGYVNGQFELTDETGNGPVWKKRGAEYYLYRAHKGKWIVGNAANKDARKAVGHTHSEELGASSLPTDARTWKVAVGNGSDVFFTAALGGAADASRAEYRSAGG